MNASYLNGFVGGMLIGFAAVLLMWFNGRIMGVSGIMSKLLARPDQDYIWRLAFVFGLILGGFVYSQFFFVDVVIDASVGGLLVAGFLVGLGTVMGNGCTSGHGICGIARFSKRSIAATCVFMLSGILTVWIKNVLNGG